MKSDIMTIQLQVESYLVFYDTFLFEKYAFT